MWQALGAVAGVSGALYAANKLYYVGGKCYVPGRLDGKLAIVTGANTGIGRETTAELARRGAKVIMACRSLERAESAKLEILKYYSEGKPTALTRNIVNDDVKACITPIKPEQVGYIFAQYLRI